MSDEADGSPGDGDADGAPGGGNADDAPADAEGDEQGRLGRWGQYLLDLVEFVFDMF